MNSLVFYLIAGRVGKVVDDVSVWGLRIRFGFDLALIGKSLLTGWPPGVPLQYARDWNHDVGAKLQNNLVGSVRYGQNLEPTRFGRILRR